ncbi:hypothetical protein CPB83DRAFT_864860 [Crepidotus variabilis]|uniref:Uncharacterized protein n=1 Tax=Crepidotus variabilis TaxID=179855 RepID=A0A9P6JIH8_9AGAR|nr:hypothetical protein CPB83DRAFT_864860 [Crepidotus variabilis]
MTKNFLAFISLSLLSLVAASRTIGVTTVEDNIALKTSILANFSTTAAQTVTGTVTASALLCKSCPKTSCTSVRQYAKGTKITINCYKTGDSVEGWNWWDYTKEKCYVSDTYVDWTSSAPSPC